MNQSVSSNVVKGVKEETGLNVSACKIIAVQDWLLHNKTNYAYGVIKMFVLCHYESGEFCENNETTEIAYFDKDALPQELANEKSTLQQILMCFESYEHPKSPTLFD